MTVHLLPPDSPELNVCFGEFRHSVFRLETLQEYRGSGEDEALAAFARGDAVPPYDPTDEPWEAMIRRNVAAGRAVQRVHVVVEPLTEYLRYELTWAYGRNAAAGEDIRIIPVNRARPWPDELPHGVDYWLFDSIRLYHQHYADDGTWLGTEHVTDPARIVLADAWRGVALQLAQPWLAYVHGDPELKARLAASKLMSP